MNKRFIKQAIKETDKLFLLLCLFLSLFGTVMVASTTYSAETGFFSRDMVVMLSASVIGLAAAVFISFVDYDIILKFWPVAAGVSVFLMLLLFPFGAAPSARSDAISWLKITNSLYLQPSEILKIAFIITMSYFLNRLKGDISGIKNVIFLCVVATVPILLVVLTGDMGSALIFGIMFIGMLFVSGVHWGYFLVGIAAVAAASPIVWFKIFDDIQRNRILALFSPESFPTEIYQQQQAKNAMMEGGFTGTGLFKGPFTQSGSIPESQNDMIFAAICEELGFIGAFVLLLAFALLAVRIIRTGKRADTFSASMICYGVMFMIMAQVVVNVGMCLSLLPVIGITLPFISAGGSSVLTLYLSVGLVLSVYRSSCGMRY